MYIQYFYLVTSYGSRTSTTSILVTESTTLWCQETNSFLLFFKPFIRCDDDD